MFINYITTSRKPGTNCRIFAKELAPILGAIYITRGKSSLTDLITTARYNGVERLFIITEYAGNPRQILSIKIGPKYWEFENTYFVVLHKLRKVFLKDVSEKPKIKYINYLTDNKVMLNLLREANVISYEDSDFMLVDKGDAVTLMQRNKEIGPRFIILRDKP